MTKLLSPFEGTALILDKPKDIRRKFSETLHQKIVDEKTPPEVETFCTAKPEGSPRFFTREDAAAYIKNSSIPFQKRMEDASLCYVDMLQNRCKDSAIKVFSACLANILNKDGIVLKPILVLPVTLIQSPDEMRKPSIIKRLKARILRNLQHHSSNIPDFEEFKKNIESKLRQQQFADARADIVRYLKAKTNPLENKNSLLNTYYEYIALKTHENEAFSSIKSILDKMAEEDGIKIKIGDIHISGDLGIWE
jgi:hypothetical protein